MFIFQVTDNKRCIKKIHVNNPDWLDQKFFRTCTFKYETLLTGNIGLSILGYSES